MNAMEIHQALCSPDCLIESVLEGRDEIDLAGFVAKARGAGFAQSDGKSGKRWGLVALARQEETTVRSTRYVLEARSWLHFLRDVPGCAVHQNMTVPEIVKKTAKEQGFVDVRESLSKNHPKREYVVQYNESTFDFLCRIMAEDGIFYYFEHDKSKHALVLADSKSGLFALPDLAWRAADVPETAAACVWDLRPEKQAVAAAVVVDEYNYLTPSTSLAASKGSGTPQYYAVGAGHAKQQEGEGIAALRLAALQSGAVVLRGRTAATEMAVGGVFKIKDCPIKSLNAQWAVVGFDIVIDENGKVDASFVAVPPDAVAAPVPARPRVAGPMTGVVCGKAGDEICTDGHGRVKVRFHWDRKGKSDDTASCWLRVAQPWAGGGYGAMFLPRVGQEVLVDFLDGDPCRPVVVGCLYNAANKPPWALPDNASVSGVKGKSTPKGDAGNEISLDDKKDKERIFVHARKLFELLAEDERKVCVVGDGGDTLVIEKGSRSVEIKKGDDSLKVKGKRVVKIDGDCEITVGGNLTLRADGKVSLQSGKSAVEIESKTALSLAGGTQLELKATAVNLKASGTGTVDGGGMLTVKGGMVKIN